MVLKSPLGNSNKKYCVKILSTGLKLLNLKIHFKPKKYLSI